MVAASYVICCSIYWPLPSQTDGFVLDRPFELIHVPIGTEI